ncbi:MAG: nickel pincer cofactor biosynthesis protein LarB [Candidatus Omnitrophota bacterium]|nr:nickel pincer cofactor biosynthesis protein LarB [Candidatus Omnitrophota bacterium]
MTNALYKNLHFARVDTDRKRRRGFPEVVFCQNKTIAQIKKISREIIKSGGPLLLTRLDISGFRSVKKVFPKLKYNSAAKIAFLVSQKIVFKKGLVLVMTAGTSDIPVAEEAVVTLELMGNKVKKLYDVGVAGVHRILDNKKLLNEASIIIVIAGMEGALASLVSGMVACPVIAVPTSCGYGSNFQGLSALLTMLNSCSPGVAVVNIDNGFGAGYFASLINR